MKKLTVYTILISVILLFVSCASTASDVNSIKKGKREYTLSDHYIFDEQGQELFFDGYEKLGDYKDPNLWNDEQRQADYDENGRLTRGFLDGSRHYPKEWFCSYDEEGNLITDDDTDYYKQLLEDYKKSDLPVFEQQEPEEDDGTWEKYEYADDGSYTYTNNRGYQKSIVIQKYDSEGRLVYDPTHPDAYQSGPHKGYVEYPNVNIVNEMVDLISASRAYEANATVVDGAKDMFSAALEIGR